MNGNQLRIEKKRDFKITLIREFLVTARLGLCKVMVFKIPSSEYARGRLYLSENYIPDISQFSQQKVFILLTSDSVDFGYTFFIKKVSDYGEQYYSGLGGINELVKLHLPSESELERKGLVRAEINISSTMKRIEFVSERSLSTIPDFLKNYYNAK